MRNVYTVKQVNAYIKNMFTQDFMLNRIYVKGEVSNCKYHTSGHIQECFGFRQSDNMDWQETEEKLYSNVPMKSTGQAVLASNTYAYEAVSQMTGSYGMAALGAVVILSGMFFLLYNVMQISMAGDVRQLGLLNTIGTTRKQIRKIYYGQILRIPSHSPGCPQ